MALLHPFLASASPTSSESPVVFIVVFSEYKIAHDDALIPKTKTGGYRSSVRFDNDTGLYVPHGKSWIKEFLFKYFQEQAVRE